MTKNQSERLKILMIGTARDTMGGISTVVSNYRAGGLFERCNITYVTSHCDGSPLKKIFTACKAFFSAFYFLMFSRVNVVHIHLSHGASFWRKSGFIWMTRFFRKPLLVHLHGSDFRDFYYRQQKSYRGAYVNSTFNTADVIVTLSTDWEEWVQGVVSGPRVITVHNSIARSTPPKDISKQTSQLLFLGRIGKRKGAFDLLNAIAAVKEEFPDVYLIMGGDGEVDKAAAMARELGIEENVKFAGWVRGDEKKQLFFESAAFLLPSYSEGMPMSVLEALSSGLPVIASSIGSISEQISDGVEGYLISPGDIDALASRIETVLSASEMASREMATAARNKFEQCFSSDVVLPRLEKEYARLAGIEQ
jgi:glycosyltransferase involved in cell wall biosynthesis